MIDLGGESEMTEVTVKQLADVVGTPVERLLEQLEERFGELSPEVTERVRTAQPEELKQWTSRVLKADSLEAVFAVES